VAEELALNELLFVLAGPMPEIAQEDKDNTGTNPVNFTYDFRLITEMQSLTDGGSLVKNTAEFRVPMGRDIVNLQGKGKDSLFYNMGNRFGLRFRACYQNLSVDNPNDPGGGSSGKCQRGRAKHLGRVPRRHFVQAARVARGLDRWPEMSR